MKTVEPQNSWRICVAPMMKYTDRHYRYFARLMTTRARLYTEMVVAAALLHGDRQRFLAHTDCESPVALQLGGSDPLELAEAAAIGEQAGFDEINLNVGCPSSRVQAGYFGACLMAKPDLVAECVDKIRDRVSVPVTVKTRIGIDDCDQYDFLVRFVEAVVSAKAAAIIVHARKALLDGVSPKDNRSVPPLNYPLVYQLRADFPHTPIVINGGIGTLEESLPHLDYVDGVMIGRAACRNPFMLSRFDEQFFGEQSQPLDRETVLNRYWQYLARHWPEGRGRQMLLKPLFGLFLGQPYAKDWRRWLTRVSESGDLSRQPPEARAIM